MLLTTDIAPEHLSHEGLYMTMSGQRFLKSMQKPSSESNNFSKRSHRSYWRPRNPIQCQQQLYYLQSFCISVTDLITQVMAKTKNYKDLMSVIHFGPRTRLVPQAEYTHQCYSISIGPVSVAAPSGIVAEWSKAAALGGSFRRCSLWSGKVC